MKKVIAVCTFASIALVFASCGSEPPKTDLNQQEQAAVDSTVNNDAEAMDSLEKAIRAQIGAADSTADSE